MDPLAKAYLKVITESSDDLTSKDQKVKGYTPKEGQAYGDDTNAKKLQPKTGPEAKGTETIEKAKEADSDLSVGGDVDGKPEKFGKNYAESSNPFDKLFNKIISEEGDIMDFSTADKPEDSTFEPSFGSEDGDGEEFGEDEDEGEGEEEVTFTLPKDLAEKLHEVLGAVLSEGEEGEDEFGSEGEDEFGSEGEDSEGEDFGGGEEEEGVEGAKPFGEAIDAEELGHALVDQERLESGLNKKGSYVVKGAVPVKKKSAQTPATGKGHDGKIKSHSTEGGVSKLTSKGSIDAGGVKVGKFLFDNE